MDFIIIPDKVRDVLHYNPETGVISWKVTRGPKRAGSVAGTTNPDGYICIKVFQRLYMGHRIAWFLHYGIQPPEEIDHHNRIRNDNRIINLRVTDRSGQMFNRVFTGVCWRNRRGNRRTITAQYMGRHLYEGDNLFTAWFRRIMAERADMPLGLPHWIDTGSD